MWMKWINEWRMNKWGVEWTHQWLLKMSISSRRRNLQYTSNIHLCLGCEVNSWNLYIICSRFILLFFYSGKIGFVSKSVLWKSKGFSGLQTALGENRALIVIYEPKVNLLISVGKYYIYGREGSWKGSVSPIAAVLCCGVGGPLWNLKAGCFYREHWETDEILVLSGRLVT